MAGVFEEAVYEAGRDRFGLATRLVLFTDGVTEAGQSRTATSSATIGW